MLDDLVEVFVQTGIESAPQGSHDGCTSESVALYLTDVVDIDASQGNDFLVDDAILVGLSDFFRSIVGMVVLFGDGIEYRTQEHVIAISLVLLDFFQRMARATDVAFIVVWQVGITVIQMDTFHLELFFQIEVAMNHYALVVLLRDERKQTFGIDGGCIRLS